MKNTVYDGYLGPRLERREQVRRVKNVIEQELTPRQKRMICAVFYEGKTVSALARELGVNKSTVSRTLRRAQERMRRCLRY